jgi:mannosyl-oligosaccharide alpha-1,2-mannosidase
MAVLRMHDEVSPISKGTKNHFGGWGASLVDSLDTLWIMGMEKDFAIATAALEKIDFTSTPLNVLNVFETTIRYLGGLLAAHDLCNGKYPILLTKATQLGEMLYVAFDTPNRMPITRWYWRV